MNISVLLKEDWGIVVNKPAGLISSRPEQNDDQLELWMIIRQVQGFSEAGCAHRIDKQTSGAIIIGKTPSALKHFRSIWHTHVQKRYLAIIKSPKWNGVVVDYPLNGKVAKTSIEVLERQGKYSLVLCTLEKSGRNHQIRKHLSMVGYPIVCDRIYGGLRLNDVRQGQLLHAWTIQFLSPNSSTMKRVQAPIPDDFRNFDFDWRN